VPKSSENSEECPIKVLQNVRFPCKHHITLDLKCSNKSRFVSEYAGNFAEKQNLKPTMAVQN